MTPEAEDRLRQHVAAIVARGAIPVSWRDDVAEELLGHLVERWTEHVERGLDEIAAADRATAELGGAAELGRDFQHAYHSRLWASTIGTLLPVAAGDGALPGVVLWMSRGGFFLALVSWLGAIIALLTMTPVRAVTGAVFLAVGGAVVWLAATAMRRRQAWADPVLGFALLVHSVMLFTGFRTPTGDTYISFDGLVALLVLLYALPNLGALADWIRGSGALPRWLSTGVTVIMLGWATTLFGIGYLPDPTQAGPADITVDTAMTCDQDVGVAPPLDRVTVTLDITWHRVDVLPLGLGKAGEDWGDAIQVDLGPAWSAGGGTLVDLASGEPLSQNGAWGLHSALEYEQMSAGVEASSMRQGRPARVTLQAYPNADLLEPVEYPYLVYVRYAHRDAFILSGELECGQTRRLSEQP